MAAAAADQFRDLFLGVLEFIDQALIALRLFDRRQIFALNVFDQRDLKCFLVVEVLDNDRNFGQSRQLRSAPAALAGNNLVAIRRVTVAAHQNGLQDPVFTNRRDQLF